MLKKNIFENFNDFFWFFSKFSKSKKNHRIFFEVEKKNEYSFDAEKSYLSIGEVFRVIPALLHDF